MRSVRATRPCRSAGPARASRRPRGGGAPPPARRSRGRARQGDACDCLGKASAEPRRVDLRTRSSIALMRQRCAQRDRPGLGPSGPRHSPDSGTKPARDHDSDPLCLRACEPRAARSPARRGRSAASRTPDRRPASGRSRRRVGAPLVAARTSQRRSKRLVTSVRRLERCLGRQHRERLADDFLGNRLRRSAPAASRRLGRRRSRRHASTSSATSATSCIAAVPARPRHVLTTSGRTPATHRG